MNLSLLYYIVLFTAGLASGVLIYYIVTASGRVKFSVLEKERNKAQSELAAAMEHIKINKELTDKLQTDVTRLNTENTDQAAKIARLEAEKEALQKTLNHQIATVQEVQEKFTKDFQILANKILEEKSAKFTIQNKENIDQLLAPLKEKLGDFEKKVEETHKSNLIETSSLRQELKNLKEISQKMTHETENLTRALKNDSKIQGNWGEMLLESILQNSGLTINREYFTQKSFQTNDGRRLQPDVVIKLPDDKWIVIDSKVSLKAYENYLNEDDQTLADESLKLHLQSMRNHIKSLSSKGYQYLENGRNLDFILMFVAVEPAYLLALQEDHNIFHEAYNNNIILVSPTTLIAALKIISSTWKYEYQNKNALEIANRGRILLDKFVGFVEDFEKIGDYMNRTEKSYNDALNKLRDGRGNLIAQARELEELGVKAKKPLSDNSFINPKLT